MRVIQFIKWWWTRNDGFNRSLAVFGVLCSIIAPFAFLIGGPEVAFVAFISVITSIIVFWIVYGLYSYISSLWKKFNKENPTEADQIVNVLRGYEAND